MSEPSETGGLPLDLNTHQQQQPTGSTIHPPTTPRVDYRKTSQSSNDLPKASKAASPRRRPGTTKQAPSGPHTGSSRSEEQLGLSPTNMSSHNNIHYTRTGRISKAKKGLKVHNCENCGRSYTRAEHLRRHQKNHAQEDALICQVPGCGKTFVRVDLLQRHQERHNEPTRDSPEQSPEGSPEPTSMSLPALEQPMMEMTTNSASTSFYETVSPVQETAPFTRVLLLEWVRIADRIDRLLRVWQPVLSSAHALERIHDGPILGIPIAVAGLDHLNDGIPMGFERQGINSP
ncbi:hypothetical protein J4E83_003647 [Alternaria metachromatica]|uniref:uncharacterized protein n=1 Tax=Alternaria metachromatica TaxID=283354 RepID=UPI0020C3B4EB|nr:uncharacterized protein J4E83_003647 [Alternaria metachromatica]KAI4626496.1 hypothetical protein J4E83_003647 [Alternaria metachromatica]